MRLLIGILFLLPCLLRADRPSLKWVLSEKPFEQLSLAGKAIAALEVAAIMNDELHRLLSQTQTTINKADLEELVDGLKMFEEHLINYATIPLCLKSRDFQKTTIYPDRLLKKLKSDYANIRYQHARLLKGLPLAVNEDKTEPSALKITITPPGKTPTFAPENRTIDTNLLHVRPKRWYTNHDK